jgi:hypothetical protein
VRGPPRLPRPCIGYPKIRLLFAPTMSLERIRCCYIQKQPTCAHKRRSLLTASCVSTNRVRGVGRERNRIHVSGIRSRRKSGLKVGRALALGRPTSLLPTPWPRIALEDLPLLPAAAFESQCELQYLSERRDPVLFEAQTTGIFLGNSGSIP